MTTVIGTQFSDLTKHEEEFGNSEACGYVDCERTPTTHYALCPENMCTSREPICGHHTVILKKEKALPLILETMILKSKKTSKKNKK
jgi:hypothetical protein